MPKPFTLHAVLEFRKQREEQASMRLSLAVAKLKQAEKNLLEVFEEQKLLLEFHEIQQSKGIDIDEFLRYQRRKDLLNEHIKERSAKMNSAKQQVTLARKDIMTKQRERKIIEQLKQKQDLAYKKYLEKKETLMLDEIAVLSHNRKTS